MKTLLIGVAVLIALELGATYYVGGIVEQRFRAMETVLGNNQFLSSKIVSYNRGLFRSEVVTNITLAALPSNTITVKHTVWNGPIILFAIAGNPILFKLAVIISESSEQSTFISVPLTSKTIFSYSGETDTLTEGNPFFIKGAAVQISGSNWSYQSNVARDQLGFRGVIHFPEINLQMMGMNFILKDIKLQYNQKRSPFGNWLGDVSFVLGEALQKERNIDLTNFQFNEESALQEHVINVTWKIEFKKVMIDSVSYGPLHFEIFLMNIDPDALRSIAQIQHGIVSEEKKQEIFKQFLLRKPTLAIKHAKAILPQGDLQLESEFSIGGSDIPMPIDKDTVQKTLEGNLQASIPKEVVREVLRSGLKESLEKDPDYQKKSDMDKTKALEQALEAKIQKLKQDGILTEKEKSFDIKITLTKGKWLDGNETQKSSEAQKPLPQQTKVPMKQVP